MLLEFLAYANICFTELSKVFQFLKHALVNALGNNPTHYYLLSDGRVLPDSIELPEPDFQTAFLYNSTTNTISRANDTTPQGRFKSLPFLSITFKNQYIQRTDISEWIGEVRANPVPVNMNAKQLLTLWSLVTNRYVPIADNLEINVVDSDANETVIT